MVVYDRFAQLDTLSSFDHSLAGAVSGILTRVVSQPLDVLKIRFQVCTCLAHSIHTCL
jgi:hypothetical protein